MRRNSVLVYCEVYRGFGHWMRTRSIAIALARRFHVVIAVTGDFEPAGVPSGIEVVRFAANAHFPCHASVPNQRVRLGGHLISVLERVKPVAILLEYFPFGRHQSSLYLIPFLRAAASSAIPPVIISSVRDIQEQALTEQLRYDKRVIQTANRFIDAVLVHSDPAFVSLADTFALAAELTIPVHHTGYVVADRTPAPASPARHRRILVSAGGGKAGEALLSAAIAAHVRAGWDFEMRVIAGTFLEETAWRRLQASAAGAPRLELLRWVPDLRLEMAEAAVSVSQCGYNTMTNLIETKVPALVVPFIEFEEDEQVYRSRKLADLGAVRVLHPDFLTPEALVREISNTAGWTPHALGLDLNGAARTTELVDELAAARAGLQARSAHSN